MATVLVTGGAGFVGSNVADHLARSGHRVLVYDRRNCGASGISFDGGNSENEVWAADLHELLQQLDAAPAFIGGVVLCAAYRWSERAKQWRAAGIALGGQVMGRIEAVRPVADVISETAADCVSIK